MKEKEITITLKDEQKIKLSELSAREKAIFDAGDEAGRDYCAKVLVFGVVIFISVIVIINLVVK